MTTTDRFMSPEQITKGIDSLLSGDNGQLKQIELARALPETIDNLLVEQNYGDVDILLGQIVSVLQEVEGELCHNAAISLAGTLNILVIHEEWSRMDRLLAATQQALHIASENNQVARECIAAVTKLAAHHIRQEQYSAPRIVLIMINGPVTLASATKEFRNLAKSAVKELALRPVLDKLLEEYLYGTKKQEEAGRLLVAFGRQSADYLIDSLIQGKNKIERDQLLKLIKELGEPAEEILHRMLQQTSPWYVTRNIISLLGETGNLDCFEDVARFLEHDDVRVKKEVLTAAGKIGGSSRKTFLLKALNSVPPQLKGHVVSLLGDIHDDSLVVPLADILEDASMHQSKLGDELQIETCKALGNIGSVKGLPILKKIIANNTIPGTTEENLKKNSTLQAAEKAIQLIRSGNNKNIHQTRVKKVMGVSMAADHVSAREAAIIRIAKAGNRQKALQKLFQLIGECAAKKDFKNAERLRERLYEIAPMALNAIIRSAEIIEQAKNGFVGRGYLDTWSELREELSSAEFSAIYHELENRSVQAGELLIRQGTKNDELFFINHGSIKVFFKQDQHEIFIKSLTSGEIAGENFFDASVWTVSLKALTPSRISVLKRSSFSHWHEEFPGLEDKLRTYYDRSNDVHNLLGKKGLSRRKFERYQLSRKIRINMIDTTGKPIGGEFEGKLFDMSKGGLALRIRVVGEEKGRLLLDKKMQITIPVGGNKPQLHVRGQVLAVHPFTSDHNDFQVHFIFDKELDQETLMSILG
ncbi:MAG: HEAT repeat domain-containing protein [Thermodesulfobacteriota bacterium]|nr:HEAT repeat domain-containing protein [Thermodesulfobacteriota bacterium]